ncbi:MAG: amidase [Gammaproteobacteria bacterium]
MPVQYTRRDVLGAGAMALSGAAIALTPGYSPRGQSLPSALHYLSLVEAARLIETTEISPVELTQVMLDRIDLVDSRLNSYATVMRDSALAQAAAAEQEISSGRYRGPLHGVPVAVKDLCFTAGVPTMGGLLMLRDHVPEFDATVVTRLSAAGAVLLGKLNMTEGALAGYHPEFQVPVNPWDVDRWAGASSSGSGAATAAGLCFASLGSDTLGSIRFPSACCGLVGLKPTYGRVSRHGILPLAESLDHIGPMARTSADVAIMFEAIAGLDPNDSTSLPDSVLPMLQGIDEGVSGLRVGFDERHSTEDVDPGLVTAIRSSLEVMKSLGARVIPVTFPELDASAPSLIAGADAVAAHSATYPARRNDYGAMLSSFLDANASITGVQYANAHRERLEFRGRLRSMMEPVDVFVCPSMPGPAYPARPDQLYGTVEEIRSLFAANNLSFTAPFNLSGSPTISMPCGFSDEGLPYSVQFVGKHLDEALLCRIGHAYEQATDWHTRHPMV